jgi:hypothetical protein
MGIVEDLAARSTYMDANIFIYYLEGYPDYERVLDQLFAGLDGSRLSAVTSQLTVAEVLVKPFRDRSVALQAQCRDFIRSRQGFQVRPVDLDILVEAAKLRLSRVPDKRPAVAPFGSNSGSSPGSVRRSLNSLFGKAA